MRSCSTRFTPGGYGIFTRSEAEEYLSHLRELRQRCLELYEKGKSLMEIYSEVFGKPGKKALMFEKVSQEEWSRENPVKAMMGVDWP